MILITRPTEDSKNLIEVLTRKGFECFSEPMLEIQKLTPKIPKAAIYITTSNNAEEYVPANSTHISIPKNGKNAAEVLEYITNNHNPEEGKIIYLRGDVITLDIKSALKDAGFDAEEVIVYKTLTPVVFTDEFLRDIYKIQIATFFSAQSLENFLALVKQHNLKEAVKGMKLLALSEKIANIAGKYDFKDVTWAQLPNQQSLIEKLEEIA
jgi:uroporphyrinogen-III synthase